MQRSNSYCAVHLLRLWCLHTCMVSLWLLQWHDYQHTVQVLLQRMPLTILMTVSMQ